MPDQDDPHPIARRIATSVRDRMENDGSSRRGFLTRSALAGGTLLAFGGAGVSLAQEDDDDGNDDDMGNETAGELTADFDDVEGTDVDVLNYALTLEHLEDAFYAEVLDTFDESDFVDAEVLQVAPEPLRREVFAFVEGVSEHESAHVEVLTQAVELLGGEPTQAATYDFGVESIDDVLELGQTLENTGVAAYAGAAPFVQSPDLLSAALSIHSVEARHAAAFNALNAESPAPNAFDTSLSQDAVLEAVGPFLESEDDDGGNGGNNGNGGNGGNSGNNGNSGDGGDDGNGDDNGDDDDSGPGNGSD